MRNVQIVVHLAQISDQCSNLVVIGSTLVSNAHVVNDHAVTLFGGLILGIVCDNLWQIHCVGSTVDDMCAEIFEGSTGLVSHGVNDTQ